MMCLIRKANFLCLPKKRDLPLLPNRNKKMANPTNLTDLMPDTSGINFFTADPDLSFLLQRHLSEEDYERALLILTDMGAVASQRMDELAQIANRQGPVLMQFDKRGQRVDEVIFHPA